MKSALLAAAMIGGCLNGVGIDDPYDTGPLAPSKIRYLCIGMENSERFGECIGCENDARRLSSLMKDRYGYPGDTLISSQATKDRVVRFLRNGIENTPDDGLFLFFYSGHGGQEWLGGKEPGGADAKDEYLCLYDSHMLDDEIWDIVSRCRGRVFLYFDACHSATMYRSVSYELKAKSRKPGRAEPMGLSPNDIITSSGFTFRPENLVKAGAMSADGNSSPCPRILCWSGCRETEYSYGGRKGGYLTLAVLNSWEKGKTYSELWKEASAWVKKIEPDQNPVQTYVGDGFQETMEVFR